jgi:hypothetical protein
METFSIGVSKDTQQMSIDSTDSLVTSDRCLPFGFGWFSICSTLTASSTRTCSPVKPIGDQSPLGFCVGSSSKDSEEGGDTDFANAGSLDDTPNENGNDAVQVPANADDQHKQEKEQQDLVAEKVKDLLVCVDALVSMQGGVTRSRLNGQYESLTCPSAEGQAYASRLIRPYRKEVVFSAPSPDVAVRLNPKSVIPPPPKPDRRSVQIESRDKLNNSTSCVLC